MKGKRHKKAKRILNFYQKNFDFEPPFKILIDGTFCKAALLEQINIADQVPTYFDNDVTLCTTSCAIAECEALGRILYGPLRILRQYKVMRCDHKKSPVASTTCFRSLVRPNALQYFLATQDKRLTDMSRRTVALPLLYFVRKKLTLELPSRPSQKKADKEFQLKLAPTDHEFRVLRRLKRKEFGREDRKKAKGKKKKTKERKQLHKTETMSEVTEVTEIHTKEGEKRRKRKRVKIAAHVKEHLTRQKIDEND